MPNNIKSTSEVQLQKTGILVYNSVKKYGCKHDNEYKQQQNDKKGSHIDVLH
jgi:hypothetical protein